VKRVMLIALLLTAAAAFSQQPRNAGSQDLPVPVRLTAQVSERNVPVTKSDLYCAGFVSAKPLSREHFVGAGMDSPVQSRYQEREFVFLRGGGYTPGTRVSIVREVADFNQYSPFPSAHNLLGKTGRVYSDIGYAKVVENRGTNTAVALAEFTCDNILPGDLVVPYVERTPVAYRPRTTMGVFPAAPARISGKIMASRDFDSYLGSSHAIYLSVGEAQGLKAGDYLRVVRDYRSVSLDQTDAAVSSAADVTDDTQQHAPKMAKKQEHELPRRVIGEVVVLSTHSGGATAIITFALEPIQLGDTVELEEAEAE